VLNAIARTLLARGSRQGALAEVQGPTAAPPGPWRETA
jgi:hypothetical protein